MIRYTMRFPDNLYTRIKTSAETNRRSIHAEILWLLEHALIQH
ncbi:MAG TPA: Arc family DNA-binding protein [Mycobacteriales bacterium]|nr:Arc family DNA-binding protein [Mycobacteriales bacterium]